MLCVFWEFCLFLPCDFYSFLRMLTACIAQHLVSTLTKRLCLDTTIDYKVLSIDWLLAVVHYQAFTGVK